MIRPPRRTATEALARVPPEAHLVSQPGMGAPSTLLAALGVTCHGRAWTLSSGILLDDYPFLPAIDASELTYRTWHVTSAIEAHVAEGRVGYVPARASAVAGLLDRWQVQVALVRVSPPGPDGMCSLGPSTGYAKAAMDAARTVIAEVDPAVPRTRGDSLVPLADFGCVVDSEIPIREYRTAPDTETSRRAAEHVLGLIPRNATIQVGLGAVSESLLRSLPDADLGSVRFIGMGTDLMVDLFDKGVLDCDDVTPAPAVCSTDLMGTMRLLDFSNENPALSMASSAVVHDACRLGGLDRFVSVNTALEVDLAANVNAEVRQGRQVSGPGGGPDFVEGAARSAGGLCIIALPAASRDGSRSRIVPRVESVTVPGVMVDAVVTEFGVARLTGLTSAQRAEALIAVAHPAHRDVLAAAL